VVSCGLGPRSLQLAKDFEKIKNLSWLWREDVVIIDNDEGEEYLSEALSEGYIVQRGKAYDESLLARVNVARAKFVVMVCDDDDHNIRATSAAHDLYKKNERRGRLQYVHVQNSELQKRSRTMRYSQITQMTSR